jgi:antitoxin HigA-1
MWMREETNIMRERTRPPTHPGGILLRQYLKPLGIGIAQAATALGVSRQSLSKILHEQRSVTPDMALRLAQALHTTPELWLNLQRTYDLWHAAHQSEDWRHVQELIAAG